MNNAHLLLVEDNEGDILLIREALENRQFIDEITILKNGSEALDFLLKKGTYSEAERPNLILLDINLPKLSGHELLVKIKDHIDLKRIPVVILTTSSSERDIQESYQNHANCYIQKPVDANDFEQIILEIERYWFSVASIPLS